MSNLRRQFIEDNRNAFEAYLEKVSDKRRPVQGLGVLSARESLKAALEGKKAFYLPLAFIHLFFEFETPEDREFVLTSLKNISEIKDGDKIADPTIAYVYAYCLCRAGDEEAHYVQLERLSEQCFMPALATMGDACIANHAIEEGLSWYAHAMDHGYMMVTPRHNKLVFKDANFLKNLPLRVLSKFDVIYRALEFLKRGIKGEHALYLDFYGIKRYLNEYWEIPKDERIKMLTEQA